jgi:hypothetical protein
MRERGSNMTDTLNFRNLEDNFKSMTDEEWQEKFELMKLHIKPVKDKRLTRRSRNPYIIGRRWTLTDNESCDTSDARYTNFINDVLKQIRSKRGKKDFCYHVYQICDLLKFEPMLNTRLVPDGKHTYIEVWLDKE